MRLNLFILILISGCRLCLGQADSLYSRAYQLIIHDQQAIEYIGQVGPNTPCLDGYTKDQVGISKVLIQNTPFSCLCDILKKKYAFTGNCNEAIGLDSRLALQVSDSIEAVYKDYQALKDSFRYFNQSYQRETEFIIRFSPVYKNTILAELTWRCAGQTYLMGKGLTYYFVFDSSGRITALYRGTIYHN